MSEPFFKPEDFDFPNWYGANSNLAYLTAQHDAAKSANTKLSWHLTDMKHRREIENEWREREAFLTNAKISAANILERILDAAPGFEDARNWLEKYGAKK